MSITVDVNGVPIQYPQTGDTGWGDNATKFAEEVASVLGKIGQSQAPVNDDIIVSPGNLSVTSGNLSVGGNASVTGNTTLTGNITVNGNSNLGNGTSDTTAITGILNVDSGVLYVDPVNNRVGINDTTPSQALDVTGNVAITGNETVGGTLGVTGDVAINTNKFNITASSGNTTIAGTLGISNGTASAPSLTPSGDTNTGLYSIGSDKIGFSANGIRQGEFGVGYGGFTGNIIQVVGGELTTRATTISGSFVDTGLSATITPKYSTSKILVIFNSGAASGNVLTGLFFNIVRGNTNIAQSTGGITTNQTGWCVDNELFPYPISASVLDSPNTTSATTYKIQFRSAIQGTTVAINGRPGTNDYPAYASILLMELQQ